MSNELVKMEIVTALQKAAEDGAMSITLTGFQRAFSLASAVQSLQANLTPAVMKPIKGLAGLSIGFKMDKTDYPDDVIKNALIEAVMYGVQPVGNQFNIIASRAYITKEGYRYLLDNFPSLKYKDKRVGLPNWETDKVTVMMQIDWTIGSETRSEQFPYSFKIEKNQWGKVVTTDDNCTGKATRKALKWLYDSLSGWETPDGEIETQQPIVANVNPLTITDIEEVQTVIAEPTIDEKLMEAGITLENLANYCKSKNMETKEAMARIEKNPGGSFAAIKTWMNSQNPKETLS